MYFVPPSKTFLTCHHRVKSVLVSQPLIVPLLPHRYLETVLLGREKEWVIIGNMEEWGRYRPWDTDTNKNTEKIIQSNEMVGKK